MIRKTIASVALAASMLASGFAQADVDFKPLENDPETIVFGFISTESSSNLKAQWQPMIDDMEEVLGKKSRRILCPGLCRYHRRHAFW